MPWPFRNRRTNACFGFDTCACGLSSRIKTAGEGFINENESLSPSHSLSLLLPTYDIFLVLFLLMRGPKRKVCSQPITTFALSRMCRYERRPEKYSTYRGQWTGETALVFAVREHRVLSGCVCVCMCLRRQRGSPFFNAAPGFLEYFPHCSGGFVNGWRASKEQRKRGKESHALAAYSGRLGGREGGSNSWPSQTTEEF